MNKTKNPFEDMLDWPENYAKCKAMQSAKLWKVQNYIKLALYKIKILQTFSPEKQTHTGYIWIWTRSTNHEAGVGSAFTTSFLASLTSVMFNHRAIHQILLENAYFTLTLELEEQKFEMRAICWPDFLPVAYTIV